MNKILGGRRFHPAALALTIAALVEGATLIPVGPWHDIYDPRGSVLLDIAGLLAVINAVMYFVSWWRTNHKLLDYSFQLSTILWLWVASVGFLQGAASGRWLLAAAWAVLAAGSAWLEDGKGGA